MHGKLSLKAVRYVAKVLQCKQIGKCAKGRSSLDMHPITKCYTFMECMFHVYSKMPRLGRIYSRNHKLLPRYTALLKV